MFLLSSCDDKVETKNIQKETFSGFAQKGPFLNGTSVTISELDASLNQTGRSYSTTVENNSGSFEQKQIELISPYVQLKADGYYFNEVSGESSTGQLSLYAISDISDVSSANINVLTHLEKGRVEYLVKEKSMTFADAKKQAQEEVLDIFNLSLQNDSTSESLNLSENTENDAILLAISCILQGTMSTADMSELMADIIFDIKTDGTLDNASLGSALIDNARLINLSTVRANLESRYSELGVTNITIPDFEKYVTKFLDESTFTPAKTITYPELGSFGINVLSDTVTTLIPSQHYSMKAELPQGTSLKIIIKGKKNIWYYVAIPSPQNWTVSSYNDEINGQIYTVNQSNVSNDLCFSVGDIAESLTIEYYENNASTPTKTKKIGIVSGSQISKDKITYPEMGMFINYYNILNDSLRNTMPAKVYSMSAFIPSLPANTFSLKVILKGTIKGWLIDPFSPSPTGWVAEEYNSSSVSQEFNSTSPKSDIGLVFPGSTPVTIEIYENGATEPTRIKQLN